MVPKPSHQGATLQLCGVLTGLRPLAKLFNPLGLCILVYKMGLAMVVVELISVKYRQQCSIMEGCFINTSSYCGPQRKCPDMTTDVLGQDEVERWAHAQK